MKVVFTGGGSGGHFYPIIAVAEALQQLAREGQYLDPKLYYFGPTEYDEQLLFDFDITYRHITAGKQRKGYGVFQNILDFFKIGYGTMQALWNMYRVFPDVVFSKGSYAAFPTLLAARVFGVPVIIHESDSRPGKVNKWASSFAKKIAVSYPEAAEYFKNTDRVAITGNPIRPGLSEPIHEDAREFFGLSSDVATILVLGGSQGAKAINEAILAALPQLLERAQIIHQAGPDNIDDVKGIAGVAIEKSEYKDRYKSYGFLDKKALRYAAGAADLVITRAGSVLFEIALWHVPALVVPLPEPQSHDQRSNAYAYARTGAAEVIEEKNLTIHILLSQVDSILSDKERAENMRTAAKGFSPKEAAQKIAHALLDVGVRHEVER